MGTESENFAATIDRALCGLAAVATHYYRHFDEDDADDFIDTMSTIESLVTNGGINHRDLVARFRAGRRTEICGQIIETGNRDPDSQMAKLRASDDPYYLATDGATNGAAMRAMAPAFFFTDFEEMVYATTFLSRITHAEPVAHVAAVMMAITYRLSLIDEDTNRTEIASELERALKLLTPAHQMEGQYFLQWLKKPPYYTNEIMTLIGMGHSAKSAPLAAALVGPDVNYCYAFLDHGFPTDKPHAIRFDDESCELKEDDSAALFLEGQPGRASLVRHDADTFYSMAYPLMTMRHNTPPEHGIFQSFNKLARRLALRWA